MLNGRSSAHDSSEAINGTGVVVEQTETDKTELDSKQENCDKDTCASVDDSLRINIDRVKAKTVKVPVEVGSLSCYAVIDTGAEVTVMNEKLGDMMYHYKFAIDPVKGFRVNNKWINIEVVTSPCTVAQTEVKCAVTVPAQSEFIMTCKCDKNMNGELLFEPLHHSRLVLAKSIVTMSKNKIPVRVINPTNSPIRIKKRTILGTLQEVTNVMETGLSLNSCGSEEVSSISRVQHIGKQLQHKNYNIQSYSKPSMPENVLDPIPEDGGIKESQFVGSEHLRKLFNDSLDNLQNEKQKHELSKLLCDYSDTFAKHPTDLGKCSIIKHKIDTCHANPTAFKAYPTRV